MHNLWADWTSQQHVSHLTAYQPAVQPQPIIITLLPLQFPSATTSQCCPPATHLPPGAPRAALPPEPPPAVPPALPLPHPPASRRRPPWVRAEGWGGRWGVPAYSGRQAMERSVQVSIAALLGPGRRQRGQLGQRLSR